MDVPVIETRAAASDSIHFCPSLHCAGMLRHAAPGFRVVSSTETLSHGWLPSTREPRAWLEARGAWLASSSPGDHINAGQMDEVVEALGDRKVRQIWVWSGDLLDEQLFAAFTITMAASVRDDCAIYVCDCSYPSPRSIRGMAGRRPSELRNVTALPVTEELVSQVLNAWSAVTAPNPAGLNAMLRTKNLPGFLAMLPALCGRYPSISNGLEIWEDWLLRELTFTGPSVASAIARCITVGQSFSSDRVGDVVLLERIVGLANAQLSHPALRLTGAKNAAAGTAATTETGRAIAMGVRNQLRVNRVDRYVGGVNITSDDPWCFDGGRIRMLPQPRVVATR